MMEKKCTGLCYEAHTAPAARVDSLLGEYGELDEVARKSLVNIVGILQPAGWEAFTADYAEMAEVDVDGYGVKLNVEAATVGQIIDDAPEGYSFAVAHFGK